MHFFSCKYRLKMLLQIILFNTIQMNTKTNPTFDSQHFDREGGPAETKLIFCLDAETVVLIVSETGDLVEWMWYPADQRSPGGARWFLDVDGVCNRAAF